MLASRIQEEHQASTVAARRSLSHAIRCGELLLEAKAQIKHGQWLPWLKKQCAIPPGTAQLLYAFGESRNTQRCGFEPTGSRRPVDRKEPHGMAILLMGITIG
jgi:hypothetical protein